MSDKVYGLIGAKLGHSFSPFIHRELGCPDYRLIELAEEELGPFLRENEIGGLNVTIPYKKTVMPLCDEIDGKARAIGSVNTLYRGGDGRLIGTNTDIDGFLLMLRRAGISLAGRKVLILGSGGASVMAQEACRSEGAASYTVISRSGPDNYGNLHRHKDAQIIVNTTPVGMYPNNGESTVTLADFPELTAAADVVYNPRRTAFSLQAEKLGIPYTDGLAMLVSQAIVAEQYFTGRIYPPDTCETVLRKLSAETMNLILIGMPGCGKSTIGRLLAEMTGRELLDTDAMIEAAEGMSIPEIFAQKGETYFRDAETRAAEAAGKESGKLIVTGGGIVTQERNYDLLHQNGWIVEITRGVDLLPTEGRPLSQTQDLTRMETVRRPMYNRFRDAAAANNSTPEECAEEIRRMFYEDTGH